MFNPEIYEARRFALMRRLPDGVLLFPGNQESPINFRANAYPFAQDSSFNYFFGLREPNLTGVIDGDAGEAWIFGDGCTLNDVIWRGPEPSLYDRAACAAVTLIRPNAALKPLLQKAIAQGRHLHYLPPYRADTMLQLMGLTDRPAVSLQEGSSVPLRRAVIALREVKGGEEIAEMDAAAAVAAEMHFVAMRTARPGVFEREIVGEMEAVVRRRDLRLPYSIIFSKRGEVLHNPHHHLRLNAKDIVINDAGATSSLGYASDVTRTLPIGGHFSPRQRSVYQTVLDAQLAGIAALRPGIPFADVHRLAARTLVDGLKDLGLFRGDSADVVETGAYALAFQCGLGHQIGLDVHDMESLGEDLVGYDEQFQRSPIFGLSNLRLGKRLCAGMAVTVEPGIYFIPQQIERWAADRKFSSFINYERFRSFTDFGGVRIEDDFLITEHGSRRLGPTIPKGVEEVEAAMTTADSSAD